MQQYLLRGVDLSAEVGLDDREPISPASADINFQNKRGINVLSASLETDVAALRNIPVRVAKLDISASGTLPILVTASKVALLYAVLDVTEEISGSVSLGNSSDHEKYIADSNLVKTVEDDPDLLQICMVVPSGVTINVYSGITAGEGSLYLVYAKLV